MNQPIDTSHATAFLKLMLILSSMSGLSLLFLKVFLDSPPFYLVSHFSVYTLFGTCLYLYGCLHLLRFSWFKLTRFLLLTLYVCLSTRTILLWGPESSVSLMFFFITFIGGVLLLEQQRMKGWFMGVFILFFFCAIHWQWSQNRSLFSNENLQKITQLGMFSSISGVISYGIYIQRKTLDRAMPLVKELELKLEQYGANIPIARHRQLMTWGETSETFLHAVAKPLQAAKLCLESAPTAESPKMFSVGISQLNDAVQLLSQANQAIYAEHAQELIILPEALHEHIKRKRHELKIHNIRLEINCSNPTLLSVEKFSWNHAINNLLENAMSATLAENISSRLIRISYTQHKKFLKIKVWNPGVIPEHIQNHLFQQPHSSKGSLGIGLLNTHTWLQRIGGDITFVTHKNQGTTFILKIPHSRSGISCSRSKKEVVSTYGRTRAKNSSIANLATVTRH